VPDDFAGQLDWLAANGYVTVRLGEVYDYFSRGGDLPPKPVVLTFDDDYRSAWETVLPMLESRDMKATFFLYPGDFGKPNALSSGMAGDLALAGMEIGSHTMTHPDLTRLRTDRLGWELAHSKACLEDLTGGSVDFLCYPAGYLNGEVIRRARICGYKAGVTTRFGRVTRGQNPYRWRRMRVIHGDGVDGMARNLTLNGLDNARRLWTHYREVAKKHTGRGKPG